jgi:Domain of unknown function (DUF4259)
MGAWGYGPMENDEALEWLANEVAAPLLAKRKQAFNAYLQQTEKDEMRMIEAEAAAALLVDLTGDPAKLKYAPFSSGFLAYQAKEDQLWSLAARVITKILTEEGWLSGWGEPRLKQQALKELLSELQHIEARNKES